MPSINNHLREILLKAASLRQKSVNEDVLPPEPAVVLNAPPQDSHPARGAWRANNSWREMFIEQLEAMIGELGRTPNDVFTSADLSRPTLSRWRKGSGIRLDSVVAVCNAAGLSPSILMSALGHGESPKGIAGSPKDLIQRLAATGVTPEQISQAFGVDKRSVQLLIDTK